MRDTILYLALGEIIVTALLARVLLKRLGKQRWIASAALSGVALPIVAVAAAWLFMTSQPASQQPGGGMMFAMVLLLALYAAPVCLVTAMATTALTRRAS